MNPQRLVAALAALAVGFGVTLVGVGFADDETVVAPVVEQTDVEVTQPSRGGDSAEQDSEPAQEPGAAEVEEPLVTTTVVPPSDENESAEPPAPITVPPGTTAPSPQTGDPTQNDPAQNDPGGGDQTQLPESGRSCVPVLRLEYESGSPEFLVVRSQLSDTQFLVLDEQGEASIDVREVEGLVAVATGARFVEFEDGVPVAFGGLCDPDGAQPASGVDANGGQEQTSAGQSFPCSTEALEGMTASLSDLELTELTNDRDVFLAVVAQRLATVGSAPPDTWREAVDPEFDSFAEFPDGCPDDIEGDLAGSSSDFFCAAAQISDDTDLFDFFVLRAGSAMVGCNFDDETNQGGI